MPTILVVDNSVEDQRYIESLFAKADGFIVDTADNLQQTLDSMRKRRPDLLLLDPSIPGSHGPELVGKIKAEFPTVPAIIVTTTGHEKLAIRALKAGAASYVPNHLLEEELLSTVRAVLEVSNNQRCRMRMLEQMSDFQCAFVLQNDRSLIPQLVGYLQEHILRMGICGEGEITRVGIALDEALVNALFHGNLELESELREQDNDSYHRMALQRLKESPYRNRRLFVRVSMNQERAEIIVRDEGRGFDPSTLPDPTDPANLEKVSGRGVLLMRTFMDDVTFNESGNCVTMRKTRSSNPE
jgi:DNA-binding NarL/FixJ family response regulator/anti-sigma regulatory factor (Ser/Thr protein kinase)